MCMEDLPKGRYTRAIEMSHHIKEAYETIDKEPRTYEIFLDALVKALSTGKPPELPASDRFCPTAEQWEAVGGVLGTALACEGKANIGLGTVAMRESGEGIMSKATIAKVREHRSELKRCYTEAKKFKLDHPVPFHDEEIFENAYLTRLNQHHKALERKHGLTSPKNASAS